MKIPVALALSGLLLLLGGCNTTADPTLPRGPGAYALVPPLTDSDAQHEYQIGPLDTLSVTVFQEPALSFAALPVDASGNITMPLIGAVQASGQTAGQLSHNLETKLNSRYLKDSQVSVVVVSSVSQHVTIEGSVTQPGIYEISGSSSLLQALALARSPTRIAKLNEVIIFRTVGGRRMGAVFDVSKIRSGKDPDPEIIGGDVVVVGFSALKSGFRDFLTTAPFFNLFRYF